MNGLYPAIFLNGKSQHVHRLEWIKHHGAIPEGCIIHHKDEDKTNWNIDNLEMVSRSDHITKHQNTLRGDNFVKYGEQSRNHKLTQSDVDYIKLHYVKHDPDYGGRSLAKQFCVTEQCISKIIRGITWKVVV